MFERFDFAFAMREVPEPDLSPPPSLILEADIRLAPDLRVSSLTPDDREAIRAAARIRNKGFDDLRLRELLYGLVRDASRGDENDPNGRLELALALSRLVSPSNLGLDVWGYASRGMETSLERIRVHYGPPAFKAKGDRWWLLPSDWEEVRVLLEALDSRSTAASWLGLDNQLPATIANAIRLFGKAAFHDTAHVRYLLLVPATEAMVLQGGDKGVGRIFRERLLRICEYIGHEIGPEDLDEIYGNRSAVAHEGMFRTDADQHVVPYYRKLDRMLAAILKRAITDADFRTAFSDRGTLQTKWYVPELKPCGAWISQGPDGRQDLTPCLVDKATKKVQGTEAGSSGSPKP